MTNPLGDVLSNWSANIALIQILPPGCALAWHLSDPTPLGTTGSEVAGGGYQRQRIDFAPPSGRTRVSINSQLFPGMPLCIIKYLAVWTSVGGGHLAFARKLPSPLYVPASGQVLVAKGDVALSL